MSLPPTEYIGHLEKKMFINGLNILDRSRVILLHKKIKSTSR